MNEVGKAGLVDVGGVVIVNVMDGWGAQMVLLGRPKNTHKSLAFPGGLETRIQKTFCSPLSGREDPGYCSAPARP